LANSPADLLHQANSDPVKPVLSESLDKPQQDSLRSAVNPNLHQADLTKLVKNLGDFGTLVDKASTFEMVMAGLGTVFSGFQADWIAYFLESFGEKSENAFVSDRTIPEYIAAPLKFLAKAYGIKTESGTEIQTSDDLKKSQEKLIGAINTTFSSFSLLNIVFRTIPHSLKNIFGKAEAQSESGSGAFNFISTKILPFINAGLMWASGAGKRQLAGAIQKIDYASHRHQVDGAWASGVQDYLCGMNSFALMARQAVSSFSPKLAKILEPVLALWISGSSLKEGLHALTGQEEETPKYEFGFLDKSIFGTLSYKLAQFLGDKFQVKLPELSAEGVLKHS
jgi:hypothetical protein